MASQASARTKLLNLELLADKNISTSSECANWSIDAKELSAALPNFVEDNGSSWHHFCNTFSSCTFSGAGILDDEEVTIFVNGGGYFLTRPLDNSDPGKRRYFLDYGNKSNLFVTGCSIHMLED